MIALTNIKKAKWENTKTFEGTIHYTIDKQCLCADEHIGHIGRNSQVIETGQIPGKETPDIICTLVLDCTITSQ